MLINDFMKESIFNVGAEHLFLRHTEIKPERATILLVHGLGESGLCYREIFKDARFANFNIIVPDLSGYGRSTKAVNNDYSFDAQVNRLQHLIQQLELTNILVVGHSLGGDLTTLLCARDQQKLIQKYVNIEGDLTQHDLIISKGAVEAEREGRFGEWFYNDFMNKQVLEDWGKKYPSCKRYYASLWFCRPEAFLQNAKELVSRNTSKEREVYQSEIGDEYLKLSIPKIYCYGTISLHDDTRKFLEEKGLEFKVFKEAFHWLMIDQQDEFYSFLFEFAQSEL